MTRLVILLLAWALSACASGRSHMQVWEDECNAGKPASCIKMQNILDRNENNRILRKNR